MLASRYLRARRKEGFISVIAGFSFIGIMLGVATLIIVMSVMNGFRKELFDKILGLNGHVLVRPLARDFTDYADIAERLKRTQGVTQAFPIVEGQALMSSNLASNGVFVRGVREEDLKSLEGIASKVMYGSLDGFDLSGGIAIGTRLANTLNVRLGDEITVVAPRGASTPFGTTPRIKRYPVTAIFEIGMSEYDATIAFLPLDEAQKFFNLPGAAHVIEVLVENPDRIDQMRPLLSAAAGGDMLLTDWKQRNATFYNTLQVERNVMFIILTLIVLVAALNIVSGMIMLVKDKGRDIGILRTMGASQGAVMRVFFITGASIGVVGTLAGLLLGVLVCANIEEIRQFISWLTNTRIFPGEIYFLSRMPAEIDTGEVTSVVVMALSLSILATLYPSWRAARLDPVEALRYE
ncbi:MULTISPECIES: lipoprotein-releasing ABC transporter permease subunit [Rhodomicrobium]|uniref:lipoprotein-releasing ABC transporter permease subunit n=1 Tax=Rhodomicrobium TaxID=1068 RepID=UPI000B4B3C4F|nr:MULTISPECIES: lipoprotein-releasing ABC transporter permease subunit [Rhodomicrobium]